jgi:cell division protein FtsN
MNDRRIIYALLIMMFVTLGCPARSRTQTTNPDGNNVVSGSVTEGDITLPNPNQMDTDIEEVDKGEFSETPAESKTTPDKVTQPPIETGGSSSNTYRVQVIASSTQSGADEVASKVRTQVAGEKVSIDYVGGLYKVRVGGYGDYSGASSLRDRLISAGYSDAWIVKAGVQ